MAPPKTTKAKAAARRRRGKGRKSRRGNIPDYASCSVKTSIVPGAGQNYAGNVMYSYNNINLAGFARALSISKAYQLYRITKAKLTVLFPYDTFVGVAGQAGRPNMYYMIDKTGTFPLVTTIDMLKQAGARPRRCDEKPVSVQWTPSVLTEEETLGGAVAAQYKLSPWLATDAQQIQHRGIYWYLEQLFPAGAPGIQYECELEVQFEFKKPLWTAPAQGAPPAVDSIPATQAEVVASLNGPV